MDRQIPLRNRAGEVVAWTLVDEEDYGWLSQYKWRCWNGYARNDALGRMHRAIIEAPPNRQTDHINRDRLDNRKGNLRLATNRKNQQNRKDQSAHGVGVCRAQSGRFQAMMWLGGRNRYLGTFDTAELAAAAYQRAADSAGN